MTLTERVLGAWELVSFTVLHLDADRTDYPLGSDATGIIMYTADGYMSAQIMRSGRRNYELFDPNDDVQAAAAAATGYLAYSGSYQVDEENHTLHHQVEVSLLPEWLNTNQAREASFAGNEMTLVADDELRSGKVRSALTWKRAVPVAH